MSVVMCNMKRVYMYITMQ